MSLRAAFARLLDHVARRFRRAPTRVSHVNAYVDLVFPDHTHPFEGFACTTTRPLLVEPGTGAVLDLRAFVGHGGGIDYELAWKGIQHPRVTVTTKFEQISFNLALIRTVPPEEFSRLLAMAGRPSSGMALGDALKAWQEALAARARSRYFKDNKDAFQRAIAELQEQVAEAERADDVLKEPLPKM